MSDLLEQPLRNWPHRYGIESTPWPSDVAKGAFYRVVQPRKCVQTHLCGHDAWPTTGFHRAARFRVKNRPILHGISFWTKRGKIKAFFTPFSVPVEKNTGMQTISRFRPSWQPPIWKSQHQSILYQCYTEQNRALTICQDPITKPPLGISRIT